MFLFIEEWFLQEIGGKVHYRSSQFRRQRTMQTLKRTAILSAMLLIAIVLSNSSAFAQIDLVGEWAPQFHEDQPERVGGPPVGDYAGLPINDAARMMADSWEASILSVPEHKCKPHPADYSPRGPANLRISKEVDTASQETIAYHTHISWQVPERTIWMDGRPHPDELAPHTWQGFSTGEWIGGPNSQVLKVVTTHLKKGWIRRNGVPRSDQAELTEYFFRHGNFLTWTSIINDPLYLTEPMIRTSDFMVNPGQQIAPYPCLIVSEVEQPHGWVPHWLPGTNPDLEEFAKDQHVPPEAMRGGAETMLPEYRNKVVAAQPK